MATAAQKRAKVAGKRRSQQAAREAKRRPIDTSFNFGANAAGGRKRSGKGGGAGGGS